MKKVSLIIPAHNEEGCIEGTVRAFSSELKKENIPHEILVVNDNSRDNTEVILNKLSKEIPELRSVSNDPPNGFGFAVRKGLEISVATAWP
jgi:dolichol-phosphate mannosyltransferase